MMIKEILQDLNEKIKKEEIAYKFHIWLADSVLELCKKLRQDFSFNQVALSGGVFQNNILKNLVIEKLENKGFQVFFHKDIPTYDANISIGQALIANERL